MRSVIIIPARYGSSRYPGKPLVAILGKPLILWVAELSAKALGVENVYIATDDQRIADVVNDAGFQFVFTSSAALTGTDRLAEAAQSIDADIYLNVQGDEPLVQPDDILKVRDEKIKYLNQVINGFSWLANDEDPNNVNIPKVIANENNQLVYMSRSAIPGFKNAKDAPSKYKKQVCIYAFTRSELDKFANFGRKSELEQSEDIEILRFLELGVGIRLIETRPGSVAVDTPEDVLKVEAALKRQENEKI